jgi:AraC-like DNA-binding protein
MKPFLEDIREQVRESSFLLYAYQAEAFPFKWHFHPEFELTYIVKGAGYRLVGDSHQDFSAGDLVLIGPNLPHTWVGSCGDDEKVEAVVWQFSQAFADRLTGFAEGQSLAALFRKAERGIHFLNPGAQIHKELLRLLQTQGMAKIAGSISLLEGLVPLETVSLSSAAFSKARNPKYENRIDKICLYLQEHFTESISLKALAGQVHMTESNFCKFFKKTLGTTFSNHLNELRISEACRFLLHSDQDINQIAYLCGFESLSYFNRVFLRKKCLSPKAWRKQQRGN